MSLYTEKRHVSIKVTEEKGVEEQKQKQHEDATERNDECVVHQHILSLSSLKNELTDCSSPNRQNTAVKGVHSGNEQADIKSYNIGDF